MVQPEFCYSTVTLFTRFLGRSTAGAQHGDVVGQELQRHARQDRRERVVGDVGPVFDRTETQKRGVENGAIIYLPPFISPPP